MPKIMVGGIMKPKVTAAELAEITGVSAKSSRRTAKELLELLGQSESRVE